ncbi:heavy-metal-associated domain-containing protein [Pseudorhodobacter turbinis]|uniref:Heavy-metal-associated domain-containing protein n=1 Tax=Pseudorhodobacter turbinis TaxID=2500533 RepID=A0A4P8EGS0_9RHOB|nr:heavy-metal-associated domain-containing protein [Pseudorhodobacter turbinis]QCO56351.1 heavy-metal-associated domain-containing protein [Pseudorhodobacter turbinis]
MATLSIPDMSCGHCKSAVEAAILKLDPNASVVVDLDNRRAEITSTEPVQALINALDAVGFPAEPA